MRKLIQSRLAARLCSSFLGLLLIVTMLLACEQPARAYVDPGSGFVFLQVAGSMAAGALFYLRHRLKRLFGFVRKSDQPAIPSAETGATENHS